MRSEAAPDTAAKSEAPFKLEKVVHVDQEKWSLTQQPSPRLDQLQGCTGALVRWCYTAFLSNVVQSTQLANGLCFIFSLVSFISCVVCELMACSFISNSKWTDHEWWLDWLDDYVVFRAPIFFLLLFLFKFSRREFSPALSISRDLHLYHLLVWLVFAELLGHGRLFDLSWNTREVEKASARAQAELKEKAIKHAFYLVYSVMSPFLFCVYRELFAIVREQGADDAVVPPSQWFGFRTMLENWR